VERRLKDLDRTQLPFAATREISIQGCEGASIARRCRNVQDVGESSGPSAAAVVVPLSIFIFI
jgi:hypothetical protein